MRACVQCFLQGMVHRKCSLNNMVLVTSGVGKPLLAFAILQGLRAILESPWLSRGHRMALAPHILEADTCFSLVPPTSLPVGLVTLLGAGARDAKQKGCP